MARIKKGDESVVIRRNMPGGPEDDFYGDTDDHLSAICVIERCIVWPRATGSASEQGVVTIEGLHIHAPPDEITWAPMVAEGDRVLKDDDKVSVRDRDWKLDGAVGDWRKRGKQLSYLFEVRRWA